LKNGRPEDEILGFVGDYSFMRERESIGSYGRFDERQ
jgi:hypothetical protein